MTDKATEDLLKEIFGHIEHDEDRPYECHACGKDLQKYAAGSSAVFWDPTHKLWLCNNTQCLLDHNAEDVSREGCLAVLSELGYWSPLYGD